MLLTRRERKIMECVGKSIALRGDCDRGLNSSDRVEKISNAVDALIQVFDDEDTAELLSSWDENFYQSVNK